ncbi:MAG TPA: hypothetical protein V6C84_17280 [Coleofasciculaceae cyanobacterium]
MRPDDRPISMCRNCRFYRSSGRRGGDCHQLAVPVQGSWTACRLAAHPFSTDWRDLEELMAIPSHLNFQEMPMGSIHANESLKSA